MEASTPMMMGSPLPPLDELSLLFEPQPASASASTISAHAARTTESRVQRE